MEQEQATSNETHTQFYWLVHNTKRGVTAFMKRHVFLFILLLIAAVLVAFTLRAPLHPYIIEVRKRFALVIVGGLAAWWVLKRYQHGGLRQRIVLTLLLIVSLPMLVQWGDDVHEYLSLYRRYRTLPTHELAELPVTDYERTHPLYSIYNYARRAVSENNQPTLPRAVRNGDRYDWTAGVEPAYSYEQLFGSVREVLAVSATTPSPHFLPENHHRVNFGTGEKMLFGANTYTAIVRAMGPWQYLNDEPSDVIYLQDNKGEYVQVVSLIRWRGILFPRPEFGGVYIIHQHPASWTSFLAKMLVGTGTWIPPEEIPRHPFLVGQNIVPYAVMRNAAESFRFQKGFTAPLPGIHNGDTRIPDQEEDANPQPFVCFFRIPAQEKLYGFFALEPYNPSQFGLNVALFYPGDGQGPIYFYHPPKHGENIIGVSAVTALVRESRKQYTWQLAHPAENRPYIKKIDGKIRFNWLSTVVMESDNRRASQGDVTSASEPGERDFISGSSPEIVLTDGVYSVPVWVSSLDPTTWPGELRQKIGPIWKTVPSVPIETPTL